MRRLFDAYIMVDWSAANKPVSGANSIWIGTLAKDARLKFQYRGVNIPTRMKARQFIEDMVAKLTGRGDKVLLGFDFSFGYPAGTAKALGLDLSSHKPWEAMQIHLAGKIREKADNSNGRYAVAAGMNYAISKGPFPFWGAPKRDQVSTLTGTKPDFSGQTPPEFREVETFMRAHKLGAPKSAWQLAYVGSVGSQTIMGLPHVHALRSSLPNAKIWPFETGLQPLEADDLEDVSVLMAEIYPSIIETKPEKGEVPDEAQVREIAHFYSEMDAKGQLKNAFGAKNAPENDKISGIIAEEGWILGI